MSARLCRVDERQERGPGSSASTGGPSTSARSAARGRRPRPAGRRRAPGARPGVVGLDRRAVDERQERGPGSSASTGGPSTSARSAARGRRPRPAGRRRAPGARPGVVGLDRRAVDERQERGPGSSASTGGPSTSARSAARGRRPRPAGRRRAPGARPGVVGLDRRAVDERQERGPGSSASTGGPSTSARSAARGRRPRPAGRRRAPGARPGVVGLDFRTTMIRRCTIRGHVRTK